MAIFNNPGNLEVGQGYAGETGEVYSERFPVFENAQMGVRALFKDLRTKLKDYGGDITGMISKYAPPNENDTKNYINIVIDRMGGKSEVSEEDLPELASAIIWMENKDEGRKYYLDDPRILEEGYKLSTLDLPSTASYADAITEYTKSRAERNIGGMISRNPYPYNPRPI